jgi:hypothetical protein
LHVNRVKSCVILLNVGVSSVGMAASYDLDSRGSIPGRVEIFLFSTASRQALRPTQTPVQVVLGLKQPGHETDYSPPSSAEVKNGCAIPPLPHVLMA